ncbi:MAG: gliding motility-associated C-terminal domain-containing protein [Flavobacteriales bacterium]|nr:gliding motility-associated C-terminal domain-containing protein [Flavobacteriales bacterium]
MKEIGGILVGVILLTINGLSQTTFQKAYVQEAGDVKIFDAIETSDGGYAMAGLHGAPGSEVAMLTKLNCQAEVEWSHSFGSASSVQNIHIRLLETGDQHLVMVNTAGDYFSNSQDVIVVKSALDGTTAWQRRYGGTGNDVGNGIIQTADGTYVICGNTSAYGSDAGSAYEDAFVMKIDPDGNVLWSTTIGNSDAYDGAYSVDEDPLTGRIVAGGRMIVNGTFYSMIATLDGSGQLQWVRAYGADNHGTFGYAVKVDSGGNYLLAGSTTLLGADFTAYSDPFMIKAEPVAGDTLWSRVYPPTDDLFDNASGIVLGSGGEYIMSVATASYGAFTTGFVPNKHALYAISGDGVLNQARIYNTGGSHYPFVRNTNDGGVLISGFSNQYTVPCCNFQPLLIKTDGALTSGCNENDVTGYTNTEFAAWQVASPTVVTDTGFDATPFTSSGDVGFTAINTLCESVSGLIAAFEWNGECANDTISFFDLSTGNIDSWLWDFGNGQSSTEQNPTVVFDNDAIYNVTLTVSNTCESASITEEVTILFSPTADGGPDVEIVEGEEAELGGDPTGPTSADFLWFPQETLDNPTIPNPDAFPEVTTYYTVTVTMPNGCSSLDSVLVIVLEKPPVDTSGSLFVPTVFSPNNDGTNDLLWVYGGPFIAYSIEIFNRWGEKVFESDDQFKPWDGKYRGTDCQVGAYYYSLLIRAPNGDESRKTGNITIFR